jgi:hypothetical protein
MAVIWMGAGRFVAGYDADAQAYITAVEAADTAAGQTGGLETATKDAINAFVVGCKSDGTWNAIKASCILAGARTLSGCLVPLAGVAPTNNNFVEQDYNRKTGLVGNATTKWLDSNRSNNADPLNNVHIGIYRTSGTSSNQAILGANNSNTSAHHVEIFNSNVAIRSRSSSNITFSTTITSAGFMGVSRASASQVTIRAFNSQSLTSSNSNSSNAIRYFVFAKTDDNAQTANRLSNSRIAFYSIGESLDLALLDARVTTLINAIAAAIP